MAFNLDRFISQYVTKRNKSVFVQDIEANRQQLYCQIHGKSVLVIGGAGTIGASYIKAILPFEPKSLVVVDINENGLAELTRDLRGSQIFIPVDYVTYPMSYADQVFEKMFINRGGFEIVANFSAHKHVRSEKDVFAVEALIKNNVLNAQQLLDLLTKFKPEHFFCVSTDKAANPVNIMGGSKKIMEYLIMSYAEIFPVTTARFANVAFSNGSLPLGFLDRISKCQPIAAPNDVKRYFVSPEESGQICMMASVLGDSGEVFFPKLHKEQMSTFSDMATDLLHQMGYEIVECESDEEAFALAKELKNGSKKYPVLYSASDTTGEKMYEEFYIDGESADLERFNALGVITNLTRRSKEEIDRLFDELIMAFAKANDSKAEVVAIMKRFLVNFDHEEKGKSLDSKM